MELTKNTIARLIRGDRNAQHELYNLYSARMFGVCLRYTSDAEVARDVLHDGFIKVFTSIRSFRNEGSFEGWVRRIMVNTALEHLRRSRNSFTVDIEQARRIESKGATTSPDYDIMMKTVMELPQQYRTVFNLYAIEEYSHAEIAAMLGITESTSKSNYSRARAILREKLEKILEINYEEFFG